MSALRFPIPLLFLTAGVLLGGCGTVSLASFDEPVTSRPELRRVEVQSPSPDVAEEPVTPAPRNSAAALRLQLEEEILTWLGTPYKWGGSDRNGVDCSAFVQNVFATALGVSIPRTTAQQQKAGNRVTRSALAPGDLVFFYTPKATDHVGIYLGDGDFAHASSSQGVMVSNLSESYWDGAFTFARRTQDLLPEAAPMRPVEPVATEEQSDRTLRGVESPPAPSRRRVGW